MKGINELKEVYFLGIGGIGMSAIARYFHTLGIKVSGYDKTPTTLTDALQLEGIPVVFEDDISKMPATPDWVVYTPAIPQNHSGFLNYKKNGIPVLKRSEVLGEITKGEFTIAVAGSHGKTTVSSMIAHILTHAGKPVTAFLGGICNNYNSNYWSQVLDGADSAKEIVVVEADEFDRSFHRLSPDMAVITAVDTDHLDIYGSKQAIDEAFVEFTNKITEEGVLVIKASQSIEKSLPFIDKVFYGLHDTDADVYCDKYWVVDGGYLFQLNYFGQLVKGIRLNIGGFHNIENAIAAYCIVRELGIADAVIKEALASFKGIRRRFEKVVDNGTTVFIDDYAHHPEEIRVFIESVRELYPKQKITAIFQPHLFSRTRDLAAEFAVQLSKADEVILLDIYPARELPMEGVTSQLILEHLTCSSKKILSRDELLAHLSGCSKNHVVLTIGAGDIDKLVQPIATLLQS